MNKTLSDDRALTVAYNLQRQQICRDRIKAVGYAGKSSFFKHNRKWPDHEPAGRASYYRPIIIHTTTNPKTGSTTDVYGLGNP